MHVAILVPICIAILAGLGYVRLLLKRRKRARQREEREEAELRELSDRMLTRLKDASLLGKKSGEGSK